LIVEGSISDSKVPKSTVWDICDRFGGYKVGLY